MRTWVFSISKGITALSLFALSVSLRLLFLFFVSGTEYTGWYQDSFHHWQIAYYSLHVGLGQNPPRMWDLSGMEYFWGLAPTFIEMSLLWLFNTTSMLPFRLFNILMGSASVVLVCLIGRRYFDSRAGTIAGLLAATSPVLLEVDTSGMLEPFGFACLLLALMLYEKRTYWTGVLLGLASLTHILFWFVSAAVIVSYLVFERSGVKFLPSLLGWLTPMTPYFWFMQSRTGDWLYALRWNILGSIEGRWISNITVPFETQLPFRAVALGVLVISVAALIYLLRKRPMSYPLHIFFISYLGLQAIIFGLTAYIVPYIFMDQLGRVLLDRLFAILYYYAALLGGVAAVKLGSRLLSSSLRFDVPNIRHAVQVAIALLLILLNILTFPYVLTQYFSPTYRDPYDSQTEIANDIIAQYAGGTIVTSLPIVTYRLINSGIGHTNILGSLYAPYGNLTETYRWLRYHNVTWMVIDENLKPLLEESGYGSPFHSTQNPFIYYLNQTELTALLGIG